MKMKFRVLCCALALFSSGAFAQSAQTNDRLFPLSESSSVNPTMWRSGTSARGSTAGIGTVQLSQTFEVVPVDRLSLRAGLDFTSIASGRTFTPTAQAKYQLLRQDVSAVNLSAGLRYKMEGFVSTASEVEAFFATGRSFGPVVLLINLVGGAGSENGELDIDVEGHAGLGFRFNDFAMVGFNARVNVLVGEAAEEASIFGGRTYELLAGAVGAFTWGPLELSLLAGVHAPKATQLTGWLGLATLGVNF